MRLQNAFQSLATIEDATMKEVVVQHARRALDQAENTLDLPHDLKIARACSEIAIPDAS